MKLHVQPSILQGSVSIPGSKSHTIRAVAIAALAEGESTITNPLDSADARSAFDAYQAFGATITDEGAIWRVKGLGSNLRLPENIIDVRNSGTTMRMALGSATLIENGISVLTGDHQVRNRPCGPLAEALNALGANVRATRGNGKPPFVVEGRIQGGEATIEAVTSQYVSSLLMNTPLAQNDTHLIVPILNERPYVHITLDWLKRQGIRVNYADDLSEFVIPGGQQYNPVEYRIPGDFSSATFFLAAGAIGENNVLNCGLDLEDTQGDKAVVEYIRQMGAEVRILSDGIEISAQSLQGCEIDMNATPDALPMMAVLACYAEGETRLVNVPQARLKETDRIAVMRMELGKMGASIQELPDGLIIHKSDLHGTEVEGHDDHRVVMSLAIAGTFASGETVIHGAEALEVTYPGFVEDLQALGGNVVVEDESEGKA